MLTKFIVIAFVLLLGVYIFTFHNEKIQPSYDNLKSGVLWNKGDSDGSVSNLDGNSNSESKDSDIKYIGNSETEKKPLTDGDKGTVNNEIGSVSGTGTGTHGNNDVLDEISFEVDDPDKATTAKQEYDDDFDEVDNDSEVDPEQHSEWDDNKKAIMSFIHKDALTDQTLKRRTSFFTKIFKLIHDFKPSIKPLDSYIDRKASVQFVDNAELPPYTMDQLLKYLIVTDDEKENLKQMHSSMVQSIPATLPENIYEKNSRGIVYVGGNKFSWLTLISIMNLRQNGCGLPVEVLIPKYEEYELNICRDILPRYNAKCIYLPRLVGEKIYDEYKFKGYQYKSLALVLSSFENVLLLDADNTPLKDPDVIFHSNPFVDNGMILWPDFWKRTTHPYFYDIIGAEIDASKRRDTGYHEYGQYIKPVCPDDVVLLHQLEGTLPDPSTESGQVFVSKKKHFRSTILSLYYNTFGPDYFYPLLSQGAAGEGDKETFIAAAHALGENYYTVKKHVHALGRFRNGDFFGSAMGQFDPIGDYLFTKKFASETEYVEEVPDYLFVHANFPKLDPWQLYKDDVIYDAKNDVRNRLFGVGFIESAKYDFELRMWENMKILLCDEKLEFINFANQGVTVEEVCSEVLKHIEFLKETVQD